MFDLNGRKYAIPKIKSSRTKRDERGMSEYGRRKREGKRKG